MLVTGNLSSEDGEDAKILLSSAEELRSNDDTAVEAANANADDKPLRLFIKIKNAADPRLSVVYRTAQFNRGKVQIVVYDESTGKYANLKNITTNTSEKVMTKLKDAFGEQNVILK